MNWDDWRLSFEIAWDDSWYRYQAALTLIALIIGLLLFIWYSIPIGLGSGLIIFHYNLYLGIDEVHHWLLMFLATFIILSIVVIDLVTAIYLFRKDRIASRLLLCSATVFTLMTLIGGYYILSVNL